MLRFFICPKNHPGGRFFAGREIIRASADEFWYNGLNDFGCVFERGLACL